MHTHRKIKQTKWWGRYVKGTKESNGRASRDFQGGPVVKNLSYNCRDTGSIPYQETKITALGNSAHGPPQVLSPCATTKTQCGQINKYILLKKIGLYGWMPELLYRLKQCLQTKCFCLSYSFRRTLIFQGCPWLSFWPQWRYSGSSEWQILQGGVGFNSSSKCYNLR